MSDSAPSPTSDGSPPSPTTPADEESSPTKSESPPTESESPPTGSESSPPSDSPSPPTPSSPPSDSSTDVPPPDDSSPPPESSPDVPPPDDSSSSSPPPSDSDSSPPSPPLDSSPPSPPLDSNSSPPPDQPPPPPSDSPPSSNTSSPVSPPVISVPSSPSPPPADSDEPSTPVETDSPPSSQTPSTTKPSPSSPDSSPVTPTVKRTPATKDGPSTSTDSIPTAPHYVPQLTPSSHSESGSNQKSSRSSSHSSSHSDSGGIIGVTVAGAVIIAFIALIFVCLRKRKRRKPANDYVGTYKPSDGSFSVKSDGYYYKQAGLGASAHSDSYYASRPSAVGNSLGSNRGYGYQSGLMESGPMGNSKSWFTYEELAEITNGFSRENILGEGGFGCVYKGRLQDGKEVAVKQLKVGSGQGEREFRAEVEIISRVHHRHLVSLVGYCIAENHRLLVYEFVPNGTLEHHLHGKGLPPMDWAKRVKIAIGSAKGLAYLHEDCHPRIIHRDIKSANILLDNDFEAQVADFGLAKLSNDTNTHVSTRVMGTFGYLAPEYASSGKLTDRSDVFSFGVVLLELVTGRKPVDSSQPLGEESLVEWARPLLMRAMETGDISELVDPRLENSYVQNEMFRMIEAAASCVRHSAPKRPRMVRVVRALDTEGDMPDLSNGVKFGQSTIFDSQNSDLQKFRKMAFGSGEFSSEYGTSGEFGYSGEYRNSREVPNKPPNSWKSGEHPPSYPSSGELDTRAMNRYGSERSDQYHSGGNRYGSERSDQYHSGGNRYGSERSDQYHSGVGSRQYSGW